MLQVLVLLPPVNGFVTIFPFDGHMEGRPSLRAHTTTFNKNFRSSMKKLLRVQCVTLANFILGQYKQQKQSSRQMISDDIIS